MEITEPPGCLHCDGLWNVQSGTVPWDRCISPSRMAITAHAFI